MRVPRHIHQQISKETVYQPEWTIALGQLGKCDFQFVQSIVASFVNSWVLAGRPDECTREQVRKRRMVLPERDHAAQQIRSSQEWTFGWRGAPEHDVIPASRRGLPAVVCELLRC